jgi:FMN phosphatase YigB (HAD superfamily)
LHPFDWQRIRLAGFEIDGTLYDPRALRYRILAALVGHCLRNPSDIGILRIIREFRRYRERLAVDEAHPISRLQYSLPAEQLGVEPAEVRAVVELWMLQRPLAYLRACRFPVVDRFIEELRGAGIVVAVLSDYPVADKLEALGLEVDLQVSAVDGEVERLKPHPRGLQRVMELAGIGPDRAVMIGDRLERDGECARRAGMQYLIRSPGHASQEAFFGEYSEIFDSFLSSAADRAALK